MCGDVAARDTRRKKTYQEKTRCILLISALRITPKPMRGKKIVRRLDTVKNPVTDPSTYLFLVRWERQNLLLKRKENHVSSQLGGIHLDVTLALGGCLVFQGTAQIIRGENDRQSFSQG